MYQPATQVPPEFMERYQAIMNGDEKLDTPAKMQAFWLFAHAQGNEHWKTRERIAGLTLNATWKWQQYLSKRMASKYQKEHLSFIATEWSTREYIGGSPRPEELTDKEYSDQCWNALAISLELFNVTKEK